MIREGPAQPAPPPKQEPYPAKKARGGDIITPFRRWIFVAGLIGAIVLALVLTSLQ